MGKCYGLIAAIFERASESGLIFRNPAENRKGLGLRTTMRKGQRTGSIV